MVDSKEDIDVGVDEGDGSNVIVAVPFNLGHGARASVTRTNSRISTAMLEKYIFAKTRSMVRQNKKRKTRERKEKERKRQLSKLTVSSPGRKAIQ